MPLRRKCRQQKRWRPFPLNSLPPELQLHLLTFLDLHDLLNTVYSVPALWELYKTYPETILRCTTKNVSIQIRNLMFTTLKVVLCIETHEKHCNLTKKNFEMFMADNMDTADVYKGIKRDDNAIAVLETLCVLNEEVSSLVQAYATDDFTRAFCYDNPGAVVPPLLLSNTEMRRISRAVWRLKLFGVLFYNYAECFGLDLSPAYTVFLDRLCDFEIDEMVTVYQFMIRHRQYFLSAFPHIDCKYIGTQPARNRDPFECPHCQGRLMPFQHNSLIQRNQEFWQIIQRKYLTDTLWANPTECGKKQMKIWHDFPELNRPNEGWELFSRYRDESGMDENLYRNQFRNFGYCFWDRERLRGWDFFEEWESEYRRVGIIP